MDARQITDRIRENLARMKANGAVEPTPAATEVPLPPGLALPEIADRNIFIIEAYRAVLRRDPSQDEVTREARLLRFLPYLYTRSRFLARLDGCLEAIQLRNRDLAAREALHAYRFAQLELKHEKIQVQIKALQRSLTEVSYGIVDSVRQPLLEEIRKLAEGTPCES